MTLKLSIGIPVYNQADTIEQTIISVLDQDDAFDEILVVDNHSTDGTSDRLKQFSEKLHIISPAQHMRMAQNWNFCVENMNGEWFSLISGDDRLKSGFVTGVKAAMNDHPKAALIRTDWEVIDQNGHVSNVHHQYSVPRITNPPKTWQEQLFGPKTSFAAFAARWDLWKEVGGFPTNYHLYQDWMFWLKLAPLGPFIRVPKVLAQYRSHERPDMNASRVLLRVFDEYCYAMETLPHLPWVDTQSDNKVRAVRSRRLMELLNYLSHYPHVLHNEECKIRLSLWADASGLTSTYNRWLNDPQPIQLSRLTQVLDHLKGSIRGILK